MSWLVSLLEVLRYYRYYSDDIFKKFGNKGGSLMKKE